MRTNAWAHFRQENVSFLLGSLHELSLQDTLRRMTDNESLTIALVSHDSNQNLREDAKQRGSLN